ncbi:ExeM/NucH family extracellular endonuclease [Roseateles sp. NT4]|uniref:ExeM/NucH family extracellular endonuclease n=1 Tax=Roseateles sp. NT4 TaxID=3453715 RepID=UPI003EEBD490
MQLKTLVSLLAAAFAAPAVLASTSGVVISQVYGAGGNANAVLARDYIELFNAGSTPVTIGGWSVQYASATGTSWTNKTLIPAGTVLQPGRYYLIGEASGGANGAALPTTDLDGSINLSGSAGKVALVTNGTTLPAVAAPTGVEDILSFGAATPVEGSPAAGLSASTAALRAAGGCTDTNNNAADFTTGAPSPRNSATAAVSCGAPINQPIVPSCPDGATASGTAGSFNVSATDADSRVNAASKVEAPTPWPAGITLGSFVPAGAAGDTATQAINIAGNVPAGSYTLNLKWDNDQAQTASCTFKVSVTGITAIYNIQGNGAQSPLLGQAVTTTGVVTKLTNNGFFLQDPLGDGNPATSDGIFVFTSVAPTVSVGQALQLSATVAEFNPGSAANPSTSTRPMTQLTGPTSIVVQSSGNAIAPVEVDLATLPTNGLEAFEGMLVTLRGPLTVQQNAFLGQYGQLTIAAGPRLNTPTNVLRPGPDALALQADNQRRTILLDDGTSRQNVNPTPYIGQDNTVRAGDTIDSVTGVIDFGLATSSTSGFGLYRIQPTIDPSFARTNPRTATPQVSGGNVRIASANVLNFFTTFTDGTNYLGQTGQGCSLGGSVSKSNCRGADNFTEFQRQRAKTVANLSGLNADVVGLMEIQNNGDTTVQHLVDLLNAQLGAGTYAVVPQPAQGSSDDAIRVAMIYKPGKLTLNGASISDPAPINNRAPFAQAFTTPNGAKFAVIVNHLKSKGSCPGANSPDADDGLQGCWNATRVQQAVQLKSFLTQVQGTTGAQDVVLLGDFNSHGQEDPIDTLTNSGAIVDAVAHFDPTDWSYIFDGTSGRLDHGLVTAGLLSKVVYATSWHINADEPIVLDYNTEFKVFGANTTGSPDYYTPTAYRSSDHDPMVMGLNLVKNITGGAGNDTLVGTDGDDIIEGGLGRDTMTGKGGKNQFVYRTGADGLDTITDFKPGQDTLVFTDMLKNVGITSADPLASGHVTCTNQADGALIGYDPDGPTGSAASRPVVKLKSVLCSAINATSFKF